jgi:hypothetical protein
VPDNRPILTCGSRLRRTSRTECTDLRNRWSGPCIHKILAMPPHARQQGRLRRFTVTHGASDNALDLRSRRSSGRSHFLCKQIVSRTRYSAEVQQRPLTAASEDSHWHTELPATTGERPEAPLVRDEEAAGPLAGH